MNTNITGFGENLRFLGYFFSWTEFLWAEKELIILPLISLDTRVSAVLQQHNLTGVVTAQFTIIVVDYLETEGIVQ